MAAKPSLSPAVVRVGVEASPQENPAPKAPEASQQSGSIDLVRETERQQTLVEQLKRLLVQRTVLLAERDATDPLIPKQLIELAGEREGKRLVAAQASARAAIKAARQAQDAALAFGVDAIRRELAALRERLAQIDTTGRTKSDRLKALQSLSKGVVAGATLVEAHAAVAEIEERRQDVLVLVAQTDQRLAQAEQDRAKLALDARATLEQDLLTLEEQIMERAISLSASQRVLAAMQGSDASAQVRAPKSRSPARATDL